MINYEEKYLKYKLKYLELKNSIGGDLKMDYNKKFRGKLNYYIKKKKEYLKAIEEYNSCIEYNNKNTYWSMKTKKKCILPSDPIILDGYWKNYYEDHAKKINYIEEPDPKDNKIYYTQFF